MSQLGRIGGQVLTDNLLRAGVDLAFETDLLYLDVANQRIGIKKSVPVYDLDVDSEIVTNNLTVTTQLSIDNIVVNSPRTFTTSVGGIDIFIAGSDIYHDRLITANLEVNDNYISSFSNSNITLDPAGTGTVEFLANTNIVGDVVVGTTLAPRNINISGDLSKQGSLILGDQIMDTVTINTDFAQSIIPGDDLVWSIGENTGDSSARRWAQVHSPDWTNITTGAWPGSGLRPQSMTVSDQMSLDGIINKISAIQSNDDILLSPETSTTYIESLRVGGPLALGHTLTNPNAYGTSTNDQFGTSVAVSGEYVIVGAPNEDTAINTNQGKAYIYNRHSGILIHTLSLPTVPGFANSISFGGSVSISDNYAIVGAPGVSTSTFVTYSGRAYIYNVTTGALIHTLINPNVYPPADGDQFGTSVAISGNYAIIGAPYEDESGIADTGKVYIYNVTTGSRIYTLNNPNSSAGDYFGITVAISGNYAIVGTPNEIGGSGAAYIYNVITGTLAHTLYNPNPYTGTGSDQFGTSVAISDNYAIVGAPYEDVPPSGPTFSASTLDFSNNGTRYVITFVGTTNWSLIGAPSPFVGKVFTKSGSTQFGTGQVQLFNGENSGKAYIYNVTTGALVHTLNNPNAYGTEDNDNFGTSVAISGNYAIVGAQNEDEAGHSTSGKAYIYNVTTGALLHTLNNPNAYGFASGDNFANSVAISGNSYVIGALDEDDAGGTSSGKVYIFQPPESTITNLLNTPLTIGSTGIGYTQFTGTNGMIVPVGTNSERRLSPEVGETRWNTDEDYLECYDGTVWVVSTGGGIEVTVEIMEDLGHVYTLMLG